MGISGVPTAVYSTLCMRVTLVNPPNKFSFDVTDQ